MEELDEIWAIRSTAGKEKQGSHLPMYLNSEARGDDKKMRFRVSHSVPASAYSKVILRYTAIHT
jgi:hypothetical protein